MLKLGVNIDHVATLRQARYRGKPHGEPDPVAAALTCETAGAHGITAHLREDRRHIIDSDVVALRRQIKTRLNLEMANTEAMVAFALETGPDIICLVPEKREELTTEGGLDVKSNIASITKTVGLMRERRIEVSLFIDPVASQIAAAAETGAAFIELHTGAFAEAFQEAPSGRTELDRLIQSAEQAHRLGLRVNAGHGLNYDNVHLMQRVPHLEELNIGHSIISRAIATGLHAAVKDMLRLMKG